MTRLLLAEAPFRTLTSRALVEDAAGGAPVLLATHAGAPAGFTAVPAGDVPDGVTEAVLVGQFFDRTWFERALATAAAAREAGARLVVHNLGLDGKAAMSPPDGRGVLDRADTIGLRDHRTANILTLWRVAAPLRVLGFPERRIAPDPTLAAGLPEGPILGIALRGDATMAEAVRLPPILRRIAARQGWSVLHLPVAMPGVPDDDAAPSRAATASVVPDAQLLLPHLAQPLAWRRQMTPARLKGLVARCDLVLTNRDLLAAYAADCGVPVIGLAEGPDRRIVSCMATLANALAPGSVLLHPAACRAAPHPVA